MNKLLQVLTLSLTSIVSFGCSSDSKPMADEPAAFQVKPTKSSADIDANLFSVSIKRSALGEEFLLQGSMMVQLLAPTFNGLKSRVVTFVERGNQLVMLESNKGQQYTSDLPQNTILAVFPITSTDADTINFDFNAGMTQIFVGYDWWASDFDGGWFTPDLSAVDVKASYIEDAEVNSKGLMIRQISQVEGEFKVSVETKYYLSRYRVNEGFEPMKSPGFDRVGYFEIQPQLVNKKDVVYVSRFDARKSIPYAVSANTPDDYKQAVRDGINYWNKAFGRDVLSVVDAPEGVVAPDLNLNIVQWIDDDDAGFAYADAQMDPFTGEILHSQVYMTSAFAAIGKIEASNWLKKMSVNPAEKRDFSQKRNLKKSKPVKGIGLKGLTQSRLCFRDETSHMQAAVARARALGANESQILKMSQDFVREVVAHEVGHTLGLRHNFAGSLKSNVSMYERNSLYRAYIKSGEAPSDVRTTSSVMDYNLFEEASLAGDFIAKGSEAFEYDQKAIDILYNAKTYENSEMPVFCTDSHAYAYADCALFDSGFSPLAFNRMLMDESAHTFASLVAGAVIDLKVNPDPAYPLDALYIDPLVAVFFVNEPRYIQSFHFNPEEWPYVQVERRFSSVNNWNSVQVFNATLKFLTDDLLNRGGLSHVWTEAPPQFATTATNEVARILYNSGVLTNSEIETVTRNLLLNLQISEPLLAWDDLVIADYVQLTSMYVPGFVDFYYSKLDNYIAGTNSLERQWTDYSIRRKNGRVKKVTIKLNDFLYGRETRFRVATSGFETTGASSLVAKTEKEKLLKILNQMQLEAFGGMAASDIDPTSLPKEARAWLEDTMTVMSFLK